MAIQKAIVALALAFLQVNAAETCDQTGVCHNKDETDEVTMLATNIQVHHEEASSGTRMLRLKFPMKDSELSLLAEASDPGSGFGDALSSWLSSWSLFWSSYRQRNSQDQMSRSALRQEDHNEGGAQILHHGACTNAAGNSILCFSADQPEDGQYECEGVEPDSLNGDAEQTTCVLTTGASLVYMVDSSKDAASQKLAVAQISEMAKRIGEKSKIAVHPDIHEEVLAALEGHAAKHKLTKGCHMLFAIAKFYGRSS